MAHKLMIWQTTKASYGFVFRNQPSFCRMASLPMVIYYIASVIMEITLDENRADSLMLVLFILTLPYSVAWHRLVLLGLESAAGYNGLKYGWREGKSSLIFIGLYCVFPFSFLVVPLVLSFLIWGAFAAEPGSVVSALGVGGLLLLLLLVIVGLIVVAPALRLALPFRLLPLIKRDRLVKLGI